MQACSASYAGTMLSLRTWTPFSQAMQLMAAPILPFTLALPNLLNHVPQVGHCCKVLSSICLRTCSASNTTIVSYHVPCLPLLPWHPLPPPLPLLMPHAGRSLPRHPSTPKCYLNLPCIAGIAPWSTVPGLSFACNFNCACSDQQSSSPAWL